ncbi:MAG: motility protein A [Zetaproteobacteria bacterium]|nr:motility protein A [Zetaproteobacteria bacterium]
MDIATPIGLALAFGLMVAAIMMGGSLGAFWDPVSLLIVVGGTVGATMINFPLGDVLRSVGLILKTFFYSLEEPKSLIATLTNLAVVSRKEGVLALESRMADVDSDFMKGGLQMVVDGQDPDAIEEAMYLESEKTGERHSHGMTILATLGGYAPAFGMVGTLIGLVLMLQNMDDPASIGPAMAVALLTTFYGAVLANVIFLPMAGKLKVVAAKEELTRDIIIGGIKSLAQGENPRILETKLMGYLPLKDRESQFN